MDPPVFGSGTTLAPGLGSPDVNPGARPGDQELV